MQCINKIISIKKFGQIFFVCAVVSAIIWYMILGIVYLISENLIFFNFDELGVLITLIVAGYIINLFVFNFIEYKWEYLYVYEEASLIYERNMTKIFPVAVFIAVVITIIALIIIFACLLV